MTSARLPRVFLCAGDESGWAIDEDRRITAEALAGTVELVERPEAAEIIHAVWWEPMMRLPRAALAGKTVICHMQGDPERMMSEPPFLAALSRVNLWIAQSRSALDKLRLLTTHVAHVPYAIELPPSNEAPAACPAAAGAIAALPANSYIIANFHRDTAGSAFGPGMNVPKLVKGPDLFAEILTELHRRGERITALLAGPRRHWLRARLRDRGVPVVFAGEETPGEDYPANILPRQSILALYHRAHLHLCTSRSEGGPRGILEAAAVNCPQCSTPVGIAPDVLHPDCLFTDPIEAVEKIQDDIHHAALRTIAPTAAATLHACHTIDAARQRWAAVYADLQATGANLLSPEGWKSIAGGQASPRQRTSATPGPAAPEERTPEGCSYHTRTIEQGAAFATTHANRPIPRLAHKPARISFWNKFTPPPWGGGNQFMLALMDEAIRQGHDCVKNDHADAHILNSVQCDVERFRSIVEPGSARVVQRIDGPISILRGTPESLEQDRLCFEINSAYATATVVQSWHTFRSLGALGLTPVRPVLVHNACDPTLFNRDAATPARPSGGPLRIIATAWSPNPGKGAAIYRWLDEHLDPARYAFTFVGNLQTTLKHAKVLPPVDSAALADLLRQHDVYLTASRNDPCSNALIEALACGLPAVYLNSGGHPELTRFGGLPFDRPDEIPALLDRIRAHRDTYRNLIAIPTIKDVCKLYLELALGDAPYRQ